MSKAKNAKGKDRGQSDLARIGFLFGQGPLSYVEQAALKSCLARGHPVRLYTYGTTTLVPDEVEVADAAAIAPRDPSIPWTPATHQMLVERFRYRLLRAEPGIIWSETDAYCLQPLRPAEGYLFGWEAQDVVGTGVLALPADSPALARLIDATEDPDRTEPGGPAALTDVLNETGEVEHASAQSVLYPFAYGEVNLLLRRGYDETLNILPETCSIHLYGDMLRRRVFELNRGIPRRWSLLGKLLKRQNTDPEAAPIPARVVMESGQPAGFQIIPRALGESRHASEIAGASGTPAPLDRMAETPRKSPGNIDAPRASDDLLGEVLVVSCMKNEGPYILEWIGYHLSIGVSHFLIYTNDCEDGTDEILDHLATRGIVTRLDNPFEPGEKPQWVALNDATKRKPYKQADRYICMDVDEFINIHTGDGSLTALMEAAKDPDLISLTWRIFGCGGQVAFEDRPVMEQFLHAAPEYAPKPHNIWGFKTLARLPMAFRKPGVHRPTKIRDKAPDPVWVNGSGHRMPEIYREDGWRSTKQSWGYGLVTLNHYAVRSIEAFLVKRDRGRVNHIKRDQGLEYWQIFNRNDEPSNAILPAARRAEAVIRMLKTDPVLGKLHASAVQWHRDKIAELMDRAEFREIYDRLVEDPMSNNVGAHTNLGATETKIDENTETKAEVADG
ncbi:MAG: glycosyltransferase family 2 protein [Pseudomonadota bacterium]